MNTGPTATKYVDAGRNDMPYNNNSFPSVDESSYYQGRITPGDEKLAAQRALEESPSAMDNNWGGRAYTNSKIESGAYADRMRTDSGKYTVKKKGQQ